VSLDTQDAGGATNGLDTCGLCARAFSESRRPSGGPIPPAVLELIRVNAPGWHPADALCQECAERFVAAEQALGAYPSFRHGPSGILPVPLRLGADTSLAGRGVTIAFLDAGFYAHPDLVEPRDRILAYVDVTRPGARRAELRQPDVSSWHGMMTSVVACGNGRLSGGLYRGLAAEADLVLVKCGSAQRIVHDDIRRGLDWVIRHRRRYGIRIVNVSCGGDYEASYLLDALSRAAERASRLGLLVVSAAGNAGHQPGHPVLPPASAPSVLTVGGLDDKNRLAFSGYDMYHSSYGPTIDGLQKPEVIAPSLWVAAPILPGTPTADQARLLVRLATAPDGELRAVIAAHPGVDPALDAAVALEPYLIRELVEVRVRGENVISGAYKHVDGTSFAAPIVASLAAQMLEAHPGLDARQLRRLILATATRLPRVAVDRQGFGVVDAGAAVAAARAAAPAGP